MTYLVRIERSDGQSSLHVLTKEKKIVGRSQQADVTVASANIDDQMLMLAPRPDNCWVAVAKRATAQVLVNGVSFSQGMLEWGTKINAGDISITLLTDTRSQRPGASSSAPAPRHSNPAATAQASIPAAAVISKSPSKPSPRSSSVSFEKMPADGAQKPKVNPLILVLAAIIVPFSLYSLLTSQDAAEFVSGAAPQAPDLFDPTKTCPKTGTDAEWLAAQALEQGLAKVERYAYEAHDGIEGVNLLSKAAVCAKSAGKPEIEQAASQRMTSTRKRIEDDLASHRTKLELALRESRYDEAFGEADDLKDLVAHRKGAYLDWLTTLQHNLEATQATAK